MIKARMRMGDQVINVEQPFHFRFVLCLFICLLVTFINLTTIKKKKTWLVLARFKTVPIKKSIALDLFPSFAFSLICFCQFNFWFLSIMRHVLIFWFDSSRKLSVPVFFSLIVCFSLFCYVFFYSTQNIYRRNIQIPRKV